MAQVIYQPYQMVADMAAGEFKVVNNVQGNKRIK